MLEDESMDRAVSFEDFAANAGGAGSTFEALSRSPQFQHIRNLVQSNPSLLEHLLVQVQNSNPELLEQINQNREEFFRLMTQPGSGGEGTAGTTDLPPSIAQAADVAVNEPTVVTVALTPEEQATIDAVSWFLYPLFQSQN